MAGAFMASVQVTPHTLYRLSPVPTGGSLHVSCLLMDTQVLGTLQNHLFTGGGGHWLSQVKANLPWSLHFLGEKQEASRVSQQKVCRWEIYNQHSFFLGVNISRNMTEEFQKVHGSLESAHKCILTQTTLKFMCCFFQFTFPMNFLKTAVAPCLGIMVINVICLGSICSVLKNW